MAATRPTDSSAGSAGPWSRSSSEIAFHSRHLRIHRDGVIGPDGRPGEYDWLETPDQVRVAAMVDGGLLLIEQHHYLIGLGLQLPGGSVDAPEQPADAARRELKEETGYHGGTWEPYGYLHPLPSLSPARIHLWLARDLTAGPADPDPTEADITVLTVSLAEAAAAAVDGRIRCAASAALVLALTRS